MLGRFEEAAFSSWPEKRPQEPQGCSAGCKGCATCCRVDLGSLRKGAETLYCCILRLFVTPLARASPSKEQNLHTLTKPEPKSGPSVVNCTRVACGEGVWGGRGGRVLSPPKGSRLKATPTCRGSADFLKVPMIPPEPRGNDGVGRGLPVPVQGRLPLECFVYGQP
jgi:hypothetical protein